MLEGGVGIPVVNTTRVIQAVVDLVTRLHLRRQRLRLAPLVVADCSVTLHLFATELTTALLLRHLITSFNTSQDVLTDFNATGVGRGKGLAITANPFPFHSLTYQRSCQ